MTTIHSPIDNDIQTSESNFISDDWNLTENSTVADAFEGKIIARMPDLGTSPQISTIEELKKPFVWQSTFQSVISTFSANFLAKSTESAPNTLRNRQQFFQRITAFGAAFLLCGIGLLCLEHFERTDKETTEDSLNIADIVPEKSLIPAENSSTLVQKESVISPALMTDSSTILSESAIPVADITAVQNSVVHSSESPVAPNNRLSVGSYSPWNIAAKQTDRANSAPESTPEDVIVAPVSPANPVVPAPYVSTEAITLSPMSPLAEPVDTSTSMPISPHERQLLLAQSESASSVRQPVDPFVQANAPSVAPAGSSLVPGMIQTNNRQENSIYTVPQGTIPQGTVPLQSISPQPTYIPAAAIQGRVPMNPAPAHTNNPNYQHGRYGQYDQYAVGQNTDAAPRSAAVSQNLPIPSGVSTLPTSLPTAQPQQGGYVPQPGYAAAPLQNNNYPQNTVPAPSYQRVY